MLPLVFPQNHFSKLKSFRISSKHDILQVVILLKSLGLLWCVPAGTFFLRKDTFLKNKPCTNVVRARRGFLFPQHIFLRKGRRRQQRRQQQRQQRQHDTETPDPVQTQIPSHTGIKYLVRAIPPSD